MPLNRNAGKQVRAVDALTCRSEYLPAAGTYDEMRCPDGSLRPQWQIFLDSFKHLSCEDLQRHHGEALLFLRENGSTFNIHGEQSNGRWMMQLDPIPYIITQEDWYSIEAAVRQRMRLIEKIFHDLYGQSTLLSRGILPPAIVYGHASFLHPCFREDGGNAPLLALCAFDIARDAEGRWRILRHLAKAPSGLGYALQYRTAMAKVFPDIIRDCKVYRLSHFFMVLRTMLSSLLPEPGREPRIVILTPGARARAYFEHAYLAAYLGYPLVQGDDLTVRDGAVWLKSIGGLERVDVILRFVDDTLCDPLELAAGSSEGIPGLTEAVRRGNVSIANPLGTGLVDSSSLSAYFPVLCNLLLKEELLLPGPSTWWCGNRESLFSVLEALEQFQWTEMERGRDVQSISWEQLSSEERVLQKHRILGSPENFIASEKITLASAPSLEGETLVPCQTVIRVFAAANNEDYVVMPGGLARPLNPSSPYLNKPYFDMGGKDVWILAAEPQKHVSLWLRPERMEEHLRSNSILTSRSAENLFWVGRYAERSEGLARLLRTVLNHYFDSSHSEDQSERDCLNCLLKTLTRITATLPGFVDDELGVLRSPEHEILADVTDIKRPGSLASTLQSMIRAAYTVRERWSKDTWRVLDDIDGKGQNLTSVRPGGLRLLQHELDHLVTSLMAFAGLGMESMIRERGWIFLDIGRRIERALQLVELFLSLLVERHDGDSVFGHLVLEATLVTTENIIIYRRRYRSYLQIETVLELLLLDATNPRALGYQLNRLQEHVAQLPRDRMPYRLDEDERAIMEASSLVRLLDPKWLTERTDPNKYIHLEEVLKKLEILLTSASEIIFKSYFSHIQKSQQLVPANTGQTI